uniref:receptor activity-modifying protein 1 isoform X2 n=1 Tax=Callithrix jacchus TaxID=9483 RepID=UPI0023DD3926|nr:receptor activity-modifying protein 1 isoform X2 [Callithrix jacchus]
MARALCRLPRRCLWLLLAHHLFMATACQEADYGALLQKLCLTQFQVDMEAVGETLWCDWGKTIRRDRVSPCWPSSSQTSGLNSTSAWDYGMTSLNSTKALGLQQEDGHLQARKRLLPRA